MKGVNVSPSSNSTRGWLLAYIKSLLQICSVIDDDRLIAQNTMEKVENKFSVHNLYLVLVKGSGHSGGKVVEECCSTMLSRGFECILGGCTLTILFVSPSSPTPASHLFSFCHLIKVQTYHCFANILANFSKNFRVSEMCYSLHDRLCSLCCIPRLENP